MVGTAKEWDDFAHKRNISSTDFMEDKVCAPKETLSAYDEVHKPAHYNSGKVEAIEAIEASMSPEEFKGYLKGNALKYLWRYAYKGKPTQDLDKAEWYLARLRAVNTGSPEQVRHPPL
jgi:hypothetical protein